VKPARRNSRASASSVSRLPRERMRAITAERSDWVNTSGIISREMPEKH
jgi:hypothetical protein